MPARPILEISQALQDDSNVYYRVLANGVENPSLVFIRSPDRTAHGGVVLREWCERDLHGLESGKVVEANLSDAEK